ncbi:MAG: hypothetical protein HY909_29670 [Deltaproteobacteria bacterium]|nr:hypothetical protein [Deltaproteobacteria bacterium]
MAPSLRALGLAAALVACASPTPAADASHDAAADTDARAKDAPDAPDETPCDGPARDALEPDDGCPLGYAGDGCAACAEGFVPREGRCSLARDGEREAWPNDLSRANSDPWLVVHHPSLRVLRPRVLALNFVNRNEPDRARGLLERITAAFREGSRFHGYERPEALPQWDYELLPVRDLRDGAKGRPGPPEAYPYENSTLYPRRMEGGRLVLDYARLFSEDFAQHYGFPDEAGRPRTLCDLFERGDVNELWLVGSGDVASDAAAYEVLEYKQRYDARGNRVPGSFDPAAGNGSFDARVRPCRVSVRVGFVNYNRGPGCFLESQAHGVESVGRRGVVPAFSRWFVPFAGFDLDARHGLPVRSFYDVQCTTRPCISYPAPDVLELEHRGRRYRVEPYHAPCGNAHYPPNGVRDYDIQSTTEVLSTCGGFGQRDRCGQEPAPVALTHAAWRAYRALAGDCDGPFLVWWFQSMPGHGSGRAHADGGPMLSPWPYLYY